jgi:hypothetical protein
MLVSILLFEMWPQLPDSLAEWGLLFLVGPPAFLLVSLLIERPWRRETMTDTAPRAAPRPMPIGIMLGMLLFFGLFIAAAIYFQ